MNRIETDYRNGQLPSGLPLAARIAAISSLRSWWQVDDNHVTRSGIYISEITKKAGGSGASLLQTVSSDQPLFAENSIGSYPSAYFDGTGRRMWASAVPFSKSGPFSFVYIGSISLNGQPQGIVSTWDAVNVGSVLGVEGVSNRPYFAHGNGYAFVPMTVPAAGLSLLIGSFGNGLVKARCNGLDAAWAVSDGEAGGAGLIIGALNQYGAQPATLNEADFFVFQEDILGGDGAVVELLEHYARNAYGVTI